MDLQNNTHFFKARIWWKNVFKHHIVLLISSSSLLYRKNVFILKSSKLYDRFFILQIICIIMVSDQHLLATVFRVFTNVLPEQWGHFNCADLIRERRREFQITLILLLQSQNANVDLLNVLVAAKREGLRVMASQKCLFLLVREAVPATLTWLFSCKKLLFKVKLPVARNLLSSFPRVFCWLSFLSEFLEVCLKSHFQRWLGHLSVC